MSLQAAVKKMLLGLLGLLELLELLGSAPGATSCRALATAEA